ncbi:S41 family peptidase [Chryseobacterium tructae]|uniref:S41 family peptidase n=1 Tax=Chryseobacterium tructae TaxID=1037380 RepID=A0ABV7XZL8_9FLAO|nr:S41 family peptidase [Chryseobacterium tructae]MDN3693080.1 S41 family peptidase [Chryseobacterium tructae]
MFRRILYSFIIFPCIAWSQTSEMSLKQVNEDVDFMIKSIDEVSVYPYSRISRRNFIFELEKAEKSISKQKKRNTIDFYKAFQPVMVKLEDGHTELNISDYIGKTDYFIFPFSVRVSEDGVFVKSIKSSYNEIFTDDLKGLKITDINSINSTKILEVLQHYTSGESKKSRLELSENYFNDYYNLFFIRGNILEITFDQGQKLKIPLIRKSEKKPINFRNVVTKSYYYEIPKEKNYAAFTFRQFADIEKFRTFLEQMFSELKTEGIQNLIIDIRDNGGGNSELGDELLKYLVSKPFSQYEKTLVKYSDIRKEYLRKSSGIDSTELKNYLRGISGTVGVIDHSKNSIEAKNKNERFTGNVYLLTSGQTFSSAADFANAFKFYKAGKIIGSETGGFIISPGEVVERKLPNSKLFLNISSTIDFNIGAAENDRHGVIPDIQVESGKALDYTLERLIKQ